MRAMYHAAVHGASYVTVGRTIVVTLNMEVSLGSAIGVQVLVAMA